jgi:hypothetical protein
MNGETRNAYTMLVCKPLEKRPLGIPRIVLRWILLEIVCDDGRKWNQLTIVSITGFGSNDVEL